MEMSIDAENLLAANRTGKIHSIFKNTINISLDKRIVSIHPRDIIKTPMSLRMNGEVDLESLALNQGEDIRINKDSLILGSNVFYIKNTKVWNPKLLPIYSKEESKNHDNILYNKEFIKDMLRVYGGENQVKDIVLSLLDGKEIKIKDGDYFSSKVYKSLEGIIAGAEILECRDASENLFHILGLGIGLTPSGDDFIMGFMSVLAAFKNLDSFVDNLLLEIKKDLKDSLDKTTFLSSELYYYTLEDKYSSIFLDIFAAIKKEDKDSLFKAIQSLLAMGHSSGTDTLCGIVFAMDLIDKITKKYN